MMSMCSRWTCSVWFGFKCVSKMIDIQSYFMSLKASWVSRLVSNQFFNTINLAKNAKMKVFLWSVDFLFSEKKVCKWNVSKLVQMARKWV
jgi:hypothetical protein